MRPTATHLIILIVVVLLLFGANRLPGLAKSLGQSLKIFKKEVSELTEDSRRSTTPPATPPTTAAPDPVVDADREHGADVPPPPPAPPAPPRA